MRKNIFFTLFFILNISFCLTEKNLEQARLRFYFPEKFMVNKIIFFDYHLLWIASAIMIVIYTFWTFYKLKRPSLSLMESIFLQIVEDTEYTSTMDKCKNEIGPGLVSESKPVITAVRQKPKNAVASGVRDVFKNTNAFHSNTEDINNRSREDETVLMQKDEEMEETLEDEEQEEEEEEGGEEEDDEVDHNDDCEETNYDYTIISVNNKYMKNDSYSKKRAIEDENGNQDTYNVMSNKYETMSGNSSTSDDGSTVFHLNLSQKENDSQSETNDGNTDEEVDATEPTITPEN